MNIAIISLEFPPEPGGIGEYAYQAAKKLSEHGHNVLCLVHYNDLTEQEFNTFRKVQNFEITRINGYTGRTVSLLQNFIAIKKKILNHKTNIILITSSTAGIIGRIIKLIYKIPYLIVGHGSEFLKSNIIHELLMQFCYNGATLILPNSKFTLTLLNQTRIKNKKTQVLYPGADEQLFDIHRFQKLRTKSKNIVLLTVGALSLRKGHKKVIDAVRILIKSNISLEYWIVGKGKEENNLKNYVHKLGLEDGVHFYGFVPRENLPQYYCDADIFILASNEQDPKEVEGFGIVLAEANLMKLPVIGSLGTGMEEIIINEFNGLLVDTRNAEKLADAIKSMVNDRNKLRILGENGYRHILENFTWSKFGDTLNSIIVKQFEKNL